MSYPYRDVPRSNPAAHYRTGEDDVDVQAKKSKRFESTDDNDTPEATYRYNTRRRGARGRRLHRHDDDEPEERQRHANHQQRDDRSSRTAANNRHPPRSSSTAMSTRYASALSKIRALVEKPDAEGTGAPNGSTNMEGRRNAPSSSSPNHGAMNLPPYRAPQLPSYEQNKTNRGSAAKREKWMVSGPYSLQSLFSAYEHCHGTVGEGAAPIFAIRVVSKMVLDVGGTEDRQAREKLMKDAEQHEYIRLEGSRVARTMVFLKHPPTPESVETAAPILLNPSLIGPPQLNSILANPVEDFLRKHYQRLTKERDIDAARHSGGGAQGASGFKLKPTVTNAGFVNLGTFLDEDELRVSFKRFGESEESIEIILTEGEETLETLASDLNKVQFRYPSWSSLREVRFTDCLEPSQQVRVPQLEGYSSETFFRNVWELHVLQRTSLAIEGALDDDRSNSLPKPDHLIEMLIATLREQELVPLSEFELALQRAGMPQNQINVKQLLAHHLRLAASIFHHQTRGELVTFRENYFRGPRVVAALCDIAHALGTCDKIHTPKSIVGAKFEECLARRIGIPSSLSHDPVAVEVTTRYLVDHILSKMNLLDLPKFNTLQRHPVTNTTANRVLRAAYLAGLHDTRTTWSSTDHPTRVLPHYLPKSTVFSWIGATGLWSTASTALDDRLVLINGQDIASQSIEWIGEYHWTRLLDLEVWCGALAGMPLDLLPPSADFTAPTPPTSIVLEPRLYLLWAVQHLFYDSTFNVEQLASTLSAKLFSELGHLYNGDGTDQRWQADMKAAISTLFSVVFTNWTSMPVFCFVRNMIPHLRDVEELLEIHLESDTIPEHQNAQRAFRVAALQQTVPLLDAPITHGVVTPAPCHPWNGINITSFAVTSDPNKTIEHEIATGRVFTNVRDRVTYLVAKGEPMNQFMSLSLFHSFSKINVEGTMLPVPELMKNKGLADAIKTKQRKKSTEDSKVTESRLCRWSTPHDAMECCFLHKVRHHPVETNVELAFVVHLKHVMGCTSGARGAVLLSLAKKELDAASPKKNLPPPPPTNHTLYFHMIDDTTLSCGDIVELMFDTHHANIKSVTLARRHAIGNADTIKLLLTEALDSQGVIVSTTPTAFQVAAGKDVHSMDVSNTIFYGSTPKVPSTVKYTHIPHQGHSVFSPFYGPGMARGSTYLLHVQY